MLIIVSVKRCFVNKICLSDGQRPREKRGAAVFSALFFPLESHRRGVRLINWNCVVLGVTGAGKSFKAKEELDQVLIKYPDDHIVIIDPENEFSPLALMMWGEVIEISAGSDTHLNPFDMNFGYGDDMQPLNRKSEFILSLCEIIINAQLTAMEKSLIDKAIRVIYEPFFSAQMKKELTPTLKDLCKALHSMDEPEAKRLATSLDLYSNGSLSAFAHQTNVDIQNRFTVFNTYKLGEQLKNQGMMIVIDYLWNLVFDNWQKGIRTWVYVDEMQVFFDSPTSSIYFANIFARFRKRGAFATGLTQNVDRILANEKAKSIVANSEMVIMLNQARTDRDTLSLLLDISDDEKEYITNAVPGSGLLRVGDTILPYVDEFPENTELYKIMSTKAKDKKAQDEILKSRR